MKLVIAEKPSLAKNIIAGIGSSSFERNDGYFENSDYIVTWAFGHLFGLVDVEEYDSDYSPDNSTSWSLDNLPFMPENFRFSLKKDVKTKKIDAGVKKQFKIIKTLLKRDDVTSVINAGDSDREGEIIVRLILINAGNKKPVERLWVPDQTPSTINKGLQNLKDDSEYDNLANEGYARTFIDWLYGINLTRYTTLKSGTLLRVGRVIAPIVKAIYDRDMEIENFKPEKYFAIISSEKTNGEIVELTSKTKFKADEKEKALTFCHKYNMAEAVVSDAKTERKTIGSGKLYSLSKLQGVLGKRYKLSMSESLEIVQKLYEAGYVTYPRTNTEYLATTEKDKIKDILNLFNKKGYAVAFRDSKTIFDDSKIESHSALTPTTKIPDESVLSEKEKNVYNTIRNRFVAVFCSEPCEVDRSTITVDVGDYEKFTLKGDIMVNKGWTQYDIYDKKDKTLPKLNIGDIINTNFEPAEKETKPPKHYTTDSLSKFLKNPFRKEALNDENDENSEDNSSQQDDEEYRAILSGVELGTEATRAGIINNAINCKYISLKNDTYRIEEAGIYYVELLEKLMIDMSKNKTIELSQALKRVYKNEMTVKESVQLARDEIAEVFTHRDIQIEPGTFLSKNFIGTCPLCGKPIKKQTWGYGCTGYGDGCKFSISGIIAGKKISEKNAKQILEKGETDMITGFKSSSGKPFNAKLKYENGKLSFVFNQPNVSTNDKKTECKCPKCSGSIINDKWAWKCEKDGCDFKVNYVIANKEIKIKDLEELIKNNKTSLIKGFKSKAGKSFDAHLILDSEKNVKFEF